MKYTNNFPIQNTVMNQNIYSNPVDLQQIIRMSAVIIVGSGTATGTMKLQVSDDEVPVSYEFYNTKFVNWADLGVPLAVTGPGNTLFATQEMCYRAVRAVYLDSSGGTGTAPLTVQFMMMSV